jgi:hypothetical protein
MQVTDHHANRSQLIASLAHSLTHLIVSIVPLSFLGPNAVIYCLNEHFEVILNSLITQFHSTNAEKSLNSFIHDPLNLSPLSKQTNHNPSTDANPIVATFPKLLANVKVHQIILTNVGPGNLLILLYLTNIFTLHYLLLTSIVVVCVIVPFRS